MFKFKLNANAHTPRTYAIGRLGNQIIRNLAVSLIAMKHDLKVEYCNKELIERLGFTLFSGKKLQSNIKRFTLTYEDYFNIHNFQTKEICNIIHKHLHTESARSTIISKNPFQKRYNANNDLFIHVRLADVANENPGINYYLNAIKRIEFDKLYVSTDDKTHEIVLNLLIFFPEAELVETDEIRTIQFASTCKHVILSHGSFSAIIGYLSFFSNVYYPEYEPNKIWHGDMFSIDGWTKVPKSGTSQQ